MARAVRFREGCVGIQGGFLSAGQQGALWLRKENVEDTICAIISKNEYRVRKFLQGNFDMYDLIVARRTEGVEKAMARADLPQSVFEDEQEVADEDLPARKRPKRQIIDEIPKLLTIKVRSQEKGWHELRVCSHRLAKGSLRLELTESNFELLLLTPHEDERGPLFVEVDEPNVTYVPSMRAMMCRYWCEAKQTWLRKVSPKIAQDAGPEELAAAARELQDFYNRNHSTPPETVDEGDE